MPTITTTDGTQIFYKDWGSGQPVVFSHGWPLSADAFEDQMFFLASHGYRVIAHDRRGHGRSSQPWQGNHLDAYADDLAELTARLDLKAAVHVGHSTGGGEVVRYIGRHGTWRVAKAVLIGAIPPLMLLYRRNLTVAPVWQTRESLLLCIGPDERSEKLVRGTARPAPRPSPSSPNSPARTGCAIASSTMDGCARRASAGQTFTR